MPDPVYARRWSELKEDAFLKFLRECLAVAFDGRKVVQASTLAAMARLGAGQLSGEQTLLPQRCVDGQQLKPIQNVLVRANLPARPFLRAASRLFLQGSAVTAVLAVTETGAAAFDVSVGFLLHDGQVQPFDYQCGASEGKAEDLVADALVALAALDPPMEHAVPILVNDQTLGLKITRLPLAADHPVLIRLSVDDDCMLAADQALNTGTRRGLRLVPELGLVCVNGGYADGATHSTTNAREVISLPVNHKMWRILSPVHQRKTAGGQAAKSTYQYLGLLSTWAGEIPTSWSANFINTTISTKGNTAVEVRERFMATQGLSQLFELSSPDSAAQLREGSDLVP